MTKAMEECSQIIDIEFFSEECCLSLHFLFILGQFHSIYLRRTSQLLIDLYRAS